MVKTINNRTGGIGEKTIRLLIVIFLIFFAILCIFPFANVISKSVSSETAVMTGAVKVIPIGFHLNAYKYVISHKDFLITLKNSIFVVMVGTLISLMLNSMTAYCLSRKRFSLSSLVIKIYVFTMIFSGGLIPGYLLVRSLGMYNSLWTLIILGLTSPFNMLIMKSFIEGLPVSLEESARIDGADHFRILFTIVIPLCKPVLASLALFTAVAYWNDFFRPLIYIQSRELWTLQLYLRSVILDVNDIQSSLDVAVYGNTAPQSIQHATIILSMIPILMVYPFLQRYFVTGMTLGAIKG